MLSAPMIAGSVSPDALLHQILDAAEPESVASIVTFTCLNGPCHGATVDAPSHATPGTACALRWATVKRAPRYAVYLLVDHNGEHGLMYMQSYTTPQYAQAKVQRLTALCAVS